MIKTLNHNKTPPGLRAINDEISALLSDEDGENSEEEFLALINKRDDAVQRHLAFLSVDEGRAFAQHELPVNETLLSMAQILLASAKDDITQLKRSQTAVSKYK